MLNKDEFTDISSETYRTYVFSWGEITIEEPKLILVTSKLDFSGKEYHSHRVLTKDGIGYYIPSGWSAISFDGGFVA
jgi:hypothetical protein